MPQTYDANRISTKLNIDLAYYCFIFCKSADAKEIENELG